MCAHINFGIHAADPSEDRAAHNGLFPLWYEIFGTSKVQSVVSVDLLKMCKTPSFISARTHSLMPDILSLVS